MAVTDMLQQWANKIYRWIPQKTPTLSQVKNTQIVAHRGAWDNQQILENTMAAFQKALDHKVWAIEFDIRWSKDNIPMIHHDASTQRVFHQRHIIEETSFKELRENYPQIPTLQEVVDPMGKKIHFMIELKLKPTPQQEEILQTTLSSLDAIQDYHFMALELEILNGVSSFPEKSFVAIGRGDLNQVHQQSLNMDIGGLTGHYLLLNNKMKEAQNKKGRKIGTGFPDSKNLFYREIQRGIPWIYTNHAVLLQRELERLRSPK